MRPDSLIPDSLITASPKLEMIVTVNLNPVLDRTLALAHLSVGQINRARLMRLDVAILGIGAVGEGLVQYDRRLRSGDEFTTDSGSSSLCSTGTACIVSICSWATAPLACTHSRPFSWMSKIPLVAPAFSMTIRIIWSSNWLRCTSCERVWEALTMVVMSKEVETPIDKDEVVVVMVVLLSVAGETVVETNS